MLDREKKQLVKDSILLLPADGTAVAFALAFYQRLFELAPEDTGLFSGRFGGTGEEADRYAGMAGRTSRQA